MQIDFTITTYTKLLKTLLSQGFSFCTFAMFIKNPKEKCIILRHDVDLLPQNALLTAQLENELGIKASYYFRIVPESFNKIIINKIGKLGHEIGYHYEDLSFSKGDVDKAYTSFCQNLYKIRELYPVETISMHGSPMSKFDSRDIWQKYDYKKLGLIGEPYFDIDFSKVLYLTDTGRRWDGEKVSVRDKAYSAITNQLKLEDVKSTFDLIKLAEEGRLPNMMMLNTHPQRWTNNVLLWTKEFVMQNIKNVVKRLFFVEK